MTWTVPMTVSPKTRCRVKVVLKDAAGKVVGSDTSNRFFTVASVLVQDPNGGETLTGGQVHDILRSSSAAAATFDVHYSVNKGRTWRPIASGIAAGGGPLSWTVPTLARNQSRCLVRVTGFRTNGKRLGVDTSDRVFEILAP